MKSAFQWLGSLLVAMSLGTGITLVVLIGMLWWQGALADERVLSMLASLQGIKPTPPEVKTVALSADTEQPSLDDMMQARLQSSLDLDLRESAIDKALGDLRTLEARIQTESQRLDQWKTSFDKRVTELQTAATDAALLELQRTLEVIAPKQAKDHIIKMLEEPTTASDNSMHDVVTVMKAMPLDKRRKVLGEFKLPEETQKMAEILREIRLGAPDTQLFEETRGQLQQQLNPQP